MSDVAIAADHLTPAVIRPGVVHGTVRIPGSKSVTHRAFLLAAQSGTPCTVHHPLLSADTLATLNVLHRMGFRFAFQDDAVAFHPAAAVPPSDVLDCQNSGTSLRLLTATAARFAWPSRFVGDASLEVRPNAVLLEALRSLGASIDSPDRAPYTVRGPMRPGTVRLGPEISSQYGSGLLLSLPFLGGHSELHMAAPVASSPYLDLTVDLAASFGMMIRETPSAGRHFHVAGGQRPRAASHNVEADWSTAAFPLVAAAITGGSIRVQGPRPDSVQGDRVILSHLEAFGAKVDRDRLQVTGGPLQSPGSIDVQATPDMFPVLAVLASQAKGKTRFTGGAALRHKESDRIHAMAVGLTAMGIEALEHRDGMTVRGGRLHGAKIHAFDDHRIHMAFCIAGLAATGQTSIDGRASSAVSYPTFHDDLARLQGGPA